jgi:hypothetical protein
MPSLHHITAFTLLLPYNLRTSSAFTVLDTIERSSSALFVSSNKYSYDLGLGNNSPFFQDTTVQAQSFDHSNDDVYQASRFLSEYHSEQPFPSPLQVPNDSKTSSENDILEKLKKPKRESYPKVQPKRHLEDVLVILTNEVWENANPQETLKDRKQLPVMIQPGNSQLDLNSIWVEMLLHDQQSTAAVSVHTVLN